MRYQITIDINARREQVLELFLDARNLKAWQPSLVDFEVISGDGLRGVGSQTRQVHRMGRREIEMISTVTIDTHPDVFAAVFEADGVWNLVENQFMKLDKKRTRWRVTSDFRCEKLWMKAMLAIAPGMFKKQTREFMENFKAFVEDPGPDPDAAAAAAA